MIKIRKCTLNDKGYIDEISRITWEGSDYLSSVFARWVKEGGFYAALDNDRVIGTVKLTILPEKTIWLEGLRVHPDYQGRKIGNILNGFIMDKAFQCISEGKGKYIEFATYYKNAQSLSIASRNGFRIKERFFCLNRKAGTDLSPPASWKPVDDDFKVFREYIPYGWKFIKNSAEGLEWIIKNSTFHKAGIYKFYAIKNISDQIFMPLKFSKEAFSFYMKAFSYIAGKGRYYEIMIPEESSGLVDFLLSLGFEFYEKPYEPNVYILTKQS